MDGAAKGVTFSVPYEMAVVRPLRQTTEPERQAALAKAHYNTDIIPQELIYIDLSTDSGVSASSTGQLAAAAQSVEPGREAATGFRSMCRTIGVIAENGATAAMIMAMIAIIANARTERKRSIGKLFLSMNRDNSPQRGQALFRHACPGNAARSASNPMK